MHFYPLWTIVWLKSDNKTLVLQKGDKQVIYGFDGQQRIPPKYTSIDYLSLEEDIFYKVGNDGNFALFNSSYRQISDFIYEEIYEGVNGFQAIHALSKEKVFLEILD